MYKFKVESMNCMSCVRSIEDAIREVDNQVTMKADVRNKQLTVQTSLPAEDLEELIESAGYPITEFTKNNGQ